jgi:hypothetical protein
VTVAWPNVTPSDIESRWRLLTEPEVDVAATRIGDAETQLRTALRLRGIHQTPAFLTSEELDDWERSYVQTVAESVARFLKNTEGWSEEREQIDDWSLTRRRSRDSEEGLLFISDAEADALVPRARPRRRAFSIRLGQS